MTPSALHAHYARLSDTGADGLNLLHIGRQASQFLNGRPGASPRSFVLEAGTQAIGHTRLQHMPPSALALEEAIAVVEDQLAPLARQLQPTPRLHLLLDAGHPLHSLFAGGAMLGREAVEQQFNRLAEVAEGFPLALSGLPDDAGFAAGLLILRETMHHLGFTELACVG